MGTRVKKPGFWKVLLLTLAVLAVIRFFNDRDDTQYSSAEPTPAPTQQVYLPSVPESLQHHVFLKGRGQGACEYFTGDVTMLVIFVDDPEAVWTQEQIEQAKIQVDETIQQIEGDAAAYNVELNLTAEYVTATADFSLDRAQWRSWTANVLESLDIVETSSGLAFEFEERFGVDSVPIVYCTTRAGRAFANPMQGSPLFNEGVLLYENMDALYHEVCHVFGAVDLYFPDEVKDLAEIYYPDSLMYSGGSMEELTAYLIGWTDTLSGQALQFLQYTAYLTQEYMDAQHELETYTGYVENFPYNDGVYTGYLVDGIMHGQGIYESDEFRTEGTFAYGALHGYGTVDYADGRHVEGFFDKGLRQGVYIGADGNRYEGSFENGKYHGQGIFTWANGDCYEGTFENGLRHGQGILTWVGGTRYEGAFENGERTGYGVIVFPDGERYEGTFVDGYFHGRGLILWANGDRYEGEFANGMRHGQGTYMWADRTTRSGLWSEGEFVG